LDLLEKSAQKKRHPEKYDDGGKDNIFKVVILRNQNELF
jgi:hypothetical protein